MRLKINFKKLLTNHFFGAIISHKKSYDEEGGIAELSERRRLVRAVSETVQGYPFRAEAPKAVRSVDSFRGHRVKVQGLLESVERRKSAI